MDMLRLAFKDMSEKRARTVDLVMEAAAEALGQMSPESRQTLVAQYRLR